MSRWEAYRDQWELYHTDIIKSNKAAADGGDPEAMELVATSTYLIQFNLKDEAIALLKDAAEAGRETASLKLADIYSGMRDDEKTEYYCQMAFSCGRIFSYNEPVWIHRSLEWWLKEHHPEWCEMREGINFRGEYYCIHTGRYGMNVFTGVGEEETRKAAAED